MHTPEGRLLPDHVVAWALKNSSSSVPVKSLSAWTFYIRFGWSSSGGENFQETRGNDVCVCLHTTDCLARSGKCSSLDQDRSWPFSRKSGRISLQAERRQKQRPSSTTNANNAVTIYHYSTRQQQRSKNNYQHLLVMTMLSEFLILTPPSVLVILLLLNVLPFGRPLLTSGSSDPS